MMMMTTMNDNDNKNLRKKYSKNLKKKIFKKNFQKKNFFKKKKFFQKFLFFDFRDSKLKKRQKNDEKFSS